MASRKPGKSSKQPGRSEELQGAAPALSKQSKKTHHISEAPQATHSTLALGHEELKCHNGIEKAIQKAIKQASFREIAPQCPQSEPQPGLISPPVPAPPPQATTPALSPDGDPSLPTGYGEVNVALFGAQSEASTPKHISPAPQGNPMGELSHD